MEHNVITTPPQAQLAPDSAAPAATGRSLSPREQLAQQISSNGGSSDGGIFAQLTSNPFFTAGFGLAGLGVALSWAQKGFRQAAALARRRLLVDVEITSRDPSYQWFLRWMTAHQRAQLADSTLPPTAGLIPRLLHRFTPGVHHLSVQTQPADPSSSSTTTVPLSQHPVSLVPGPGRHILLYNSTLIAMNRQRDSKAFSTTTSEPFETITLTTLYSRRHIFNSMLSAARTLAARETTGKTTIYTAKMMEWAPFGQPKRRRPLSSVVLDTGVKEHIVADIRAFLSARTWYLDRGIPYRRGYLLYGPPGTGKSSFIEALAGELGFDIAMLHLSQRGLTDDLLYHLLSHVPPRTLVLLEDADAAFTNRRASDEHGYRGATVTFSGLLNALDGVVSAEERIIVLTTNHVEKLDEAIVRPGRVDLTVRLGEASEAQFRQMWRRFYGSEATATAATLGRDGGGGGGETATTTAAQEEKEREEREEVELENSFIHRCRSLDLIDRVSTAALQGLFLVHKDDPRGAVRDAEMLLQVLPRGTGSGSGSGSGDVTGDGSGGGSGSGNGSGNGRAKEGAGGS